MKAVQPDLISGIRGKKHQHHFFCCREELLGIPRGDKKKDIDWSKISPSRPALPPAALAPIITKLSTADILALLKAQGEPASS